MVHYILAHRRMFYGLIPCLVVTGLSILCTTFFSTRPIHTGTCVATDCGNKTEKAEWASPGAVTALLLADMYRRQGAPDLAQRVIGRHMADFDTSTRQLITTASIHDKEPLPVPDIPSLISHESRRPDRTIYSILMQLTCDPLGQQQQLLTEIATLRSDSCSQADSPCGRCLDSIIEYIRFAHTLGPTPAKREHALESRDNRLRVALQLGNSLSNYRNTHGRYPASLKDLRDVPTHIADLYSYRCPEVGTVRPQSVVITETHTSTQADYIVIYADGHPEVIRSSSVTVPKDRASSR